VDEVDEVDEVDRRCGSRSVIQLTDVRFWPLLSVRDAFLLESGRERTPGGAEVRIRKGGRGVVTILKKS